jgi:hypothetical protein
MVTEITRGMAVAPAWPVTPRPEIVLPPGFALRIDYDPASSPASLLITAYLDDAPVGQAHLDPRAVGQRLRLDVTSSNGPATSGAVAREPKLRLTPQGAMTAIEMEAVRAPAPRRELMPAPPASSAPDDVARADAAPAGAAPADATPGDIAPLNDGATAELRRIAREGYIDSWWEDERASHPTNALVWLENGTGLVLPAVAIRPRPATLTARVAALLRGLRAGASDMASDLLASPPRFRRFDPAGWASWRASWRAAHEPSGAGDV